MTLRTRLKRLEAKARQSLDSAKKRDEDLSHEDWLELFEAWGEDGDFAGEPDFPAALAFYRQAIHEAQKQTDPPFDPPADFLPSLADLPALRRFNWRDKLRFPAVHEGWWWLTEMLRRLEEGIAPVTTVEFAELDHWFCAHEDRLYQLSLPSQVLELGEGRCASVSSLRYDLRQGVRAFGAGELAQDLRRLRARYGGEAP